MPRLIAQMLLGVGILSFFGAIGLPAYRWARPKVIIISPSQAIFDQRQLNLPIDDN
jgi:hypothetical protein